MSKKVEIIILPTGEVKMQAHGFKGRECLKATEPFRRALGIKDEAIIPTADMYSHEEIKQTEKITNGNN